MISFSSAALIDGAVQGYHLNELSGNALDSVGSNDGTVTGATQGVTGILNNAYSFDGASDTVIANSAIIGDTTATVMGWFKTSVSVGQQKLVLLNTDTTADEGWGAGINNNGLNIIIPGVIFTTTGPASSDGDWHSYMLTKNGNVYNLYKDGDSSVIVTHTTASGTFSDKFKLGGNSFGTAWFNGDLDETVIFDEVKTTSDFSEFHNSGNGIAYPFGVSPAIVLESPLNDTTFADIGTNFTVSGNVTDFNTTNVTYYVWNSTGEIHNKTTILLSPSQTFNETLFIDEFVIADYIWNAQVCYENSTFSNCIFADNNFTFSVNIFNQVDILYNAEITEGASNLINSSIILLPGNVLTNALLEYNGTNYTTSLLFSGGVYTILSSTIAPIVDTDTNFTFKFYYLINGVYSPSEDTNQTVLNTLFGICGGVSNDPLFNLFLVDEFSGITITGDIEISAEIVSISSDEVVGNLNSTFNSVDNVSICFTPPSVYSLYYLNAEIRYSATGYASEFYFIQNSDLQNFPSNITLYDLNLTDSTEFLITYKNNDFITVEGAIIQLQRRFIGEDVFKTVEAPITADGGKAVVHIDLNTNQYRASVVKDGVVLDFFEDIVFNCDNELSGDCTHSLDGRVNPNNDIPIEELTDFSYSISVNEDNKTITVLFSVPSGVPSSINVLLNQIDTFGNLTSCNTTVITSAGSITCDYTDSIEANILELSISKNGVQLAVASYSNNPELDMDGINFFIMFLFMISLVGMAIASPEWMLIISVMVLMIGGTLLLVSGMNLVIGLGALAWLIVAIGIIIFKMAKQEDR